MPTKKAPSPSGLTRRQFLKLIGLSGLSAFLAECRPFNDATTPPVQATVIPIENAIPTTVPPTAAASPTAASVSKAAVAIGQAKNYEPGLLRQELVRMLDDLGGLGDLIKPGAHVGIKPNLTGAPGWGWALPGPASEFFITHPALVGELVKLFLDAGAGKVTILEALGDESIYSAWGYTDMADAVGAELLDLNKPDPYASFQVVPVPPKHNVYESFKMNQVLNELDVFVSVAKMKCHATAGITLSMKNLFGLVPAAAYKRDPADNHRSAFHSTEKFDRRVPRIIVDLNRARPIHLSILDGILTCEGGEGPWIEGIRQVKAGLLVAGKNPLATDTVGVALMGYDAAGESGKQPFIHGENHYALAAEAGLGSTSLADVEIFGPSIESVRVPFKPAP